MRSLSEYSSRFAPFAFDAWDGHGVISGCLVAHPGNDGGFGSLLDGNSLRSGDGAAANWSRVCGDGLSELFG